MNDSPELVGMTAVARLDRHITSDEVERLVGDDADTFELMCAAEAIMASVPRGVTLFLTSPDMMLDWQDALAVLTGRYQLSWWSKHRKFGPYSKEAQNAARSLARLRRRLVEASFVVHQRVTGERLDQSTRRSLERLVNAHLDEFRARRDELLASTGLDKEREVTADVQRLLDLDDEAFRDAVGRDVNQRGHVDLFAHPLVRQRWHKALRDIGETILRDVGLFKAAVTVKSARVHEMLTIPDRALAAADFDDPEVFAGKLTFLTHVRARLVEAEQHRRMWTKRLTEQVYEPARDSLRDDYGPEYLRYRVEEDDAPARQAQPLAVPHPKVFKSLRRTLLHAGWTVRTIHDGQRTWLVATIHPISRRDGQLVASSALTGTDPRNPEWTTLTYAAYDPGQETHLLLPYDEFMTAARTRVPRIPAGVGEEISAGGRMQFLPPYGYRWTDPIPGDVLDNLDYTYGKTQS